MRYNEFFEPFKQAHYGWSFGRIKTADARQEIERLRRLVPLIEPNEDRQTAEYVLRDFEAEISPESQDRMARAVDVISMAMDEGGTIDEQLTRAEEGLSAVTRIAGETDDRSEQHAILSMNEMLADVIMRLRDQRSDGAEYPRVAGDAIPAEPADL